MKTIIILAVIACVASESLYVLEKLDMNELIKNFDQLKEFTDCLLERIPCNKVFESYRVNTLEAVQQSCRRCSPHIKHMFWQYLQAIKAMLPDEYLEFKRKYDVHNKYFDAHEMELNKYMHDTDVEI